MLFSAHYTIIRFQPEVLGGQTGMQQQNQQSYLRNGVDALAVRVGQMQAQLLRLDTLGARLAKMSGMKPQDLISISYHHKAALLCRLRSRMYP